MTRLPQREGVGGAGWPARSSQLPRHRIGQHQMTTCSIQVRYGQGQGSGRFLEISPAKPLLRRDAEPARGAPAATTCAGRQVPLQPQLPVGKLRLGEGRGLSRDGTAASLFPGRRSQPPEGFSPRERRTSREVTGAFSKCSSRQCRPFF